MRNKCSLKKISGRHILIMVIMACLSGFQNSADDAAGRLPNILLVTVDDMNANSVGVFGCRLKGTTPAIDRLAGDGLRFEHAHVQVANCYPSRNVLLSGRYPHSSGVEGFYQVKNDYPVMVDLMKQAGYFTAIFNKIQHSTPYQPYPWDQELDHYGEQKHHRKDPLSYFTTTKAGIAASKEAGKPFFLVQNISDPHKPFYGMNGRSRLVDDPYVPSQVFSPDEVPIPGFLPDHPDVRLELAHYYSSVRRADDCLASILTALEESGEKDRTIIVFLSDHGMPFPFAKTCVYHHSTRTPLIFVWPGVIKPGKTEDKHMVSAVDFLPTMLDITGQAIPEGVEGRSFLPVLRGNKQKGRDHVIKEYNENSGGGRHPMRSVESRRYGYIFNPWSDGQRRFRTATMNMLTYRVMQDMAKEDETMAERLRLFDFRVVEEFYDYRKDPDALNNLIDDPAYQELIGEYRQILEQWMVETNDHALEAFRNRDNPGEMKAYVDARQEESNKRRQK